MKKLATYDTIKKIVKYMKVNFIRTSDPIFRQPSTTYAVGDIVYVKGVGAKYYLLCVTAGTTGGGDITLPSPIAEKDTVTDGTVTWTIRKIGSGGDVVPLGAIIAYSANGELPSGYLLCDGAAVSRTMYPDLFSVIGTTYGAGDGNTTFNLPNYADGKFPEGSAVAGTVKRAGLPNITGSITAKDYSIGCNTESVNDGALRGEDYTKHSAGNSSASAIYMSRIRFDASLSNGIYGASDTVQPPALTCRYIIKAFDGQTTDSALIDITQYANELATKANRQLSNLDTANLACHVVVDSYYNSTTGDWWRVYDDGWIEQGSGAGQSGTITLLKPFANTKYTVTTRVLTGSGNMEWGEYGKNTNRTTTTFSVGTNPVSWIACGMGAQS